MTRPDLSVLPADLAALYGGELHNVIAQFVGDQLVLPVEPAAVEFRRWLESQPAPAYLSAVAS
jgi:hypothetical protein